MSARCSRRIQSAESTRDRGGWRMIVALLGCVVMGQLAGGCGSSSGAGSPGVRGSATRVPASAWSRECSRWEGTPYRWGGNNRRGIDCSGFVVQVYLKVAGVQLPRTSREQYRTGRSVSRRDLRAGDLVFFNTTGRGVSHVGLMVAADRFAHASESRGVTYARLGEAYWTRTYVGGRRVLRRRAKSLTLRKRCQQTA